MAASYPSSIWTPSHITTGTVLSASLFTDLAAELDAIENELNAEIQGSAGSLAERIDMFMDDDGGCANIKLCDASDTQRRRCRAGVQVISVADLTSQTRSAYGTITFSPPLAATEQNVWAFVSLQTLDGDNLGSASIPSFVNFVHGTGTTTSFQFRVCTGNNTPPATDAKFILHWFAVENTFSTGVPLP